MREDPADAVSQPAEATSPPPPPPETRGADVGEGSSDADASKGTMAGEYVSFVDNSRRADNACSSNRLGEDEGSGWYEVGRHHEVWSEGE